jgi:hypothetical protein
MTLRRGEGPGMTGMGERKPVRPAIPKCRALRGLLRLTRHAIPNDTFPTTIIACRRRALGGIHDLCAFLAVRPPVARRRCDRDVRRLLKRRACGNLRIRSLVLGSRLLRRLRPLVGIGDREAHREPRQDQAALLRCAGRRQGNRQRGPHRGRRRRHHQRKFRRRPGAAGLLLRGAVLGSWRSQDRARYHPQAARADAQASGVARIEADVQLPVGRAGVELQQRPHQGGVGLEGQEGALGRTLAKSMSRFSKRPSTAFCFSPI